MINKSDSVLMHLLCGRCSLLALSVVFFPFDSAAQDACMPLSVVGAVIADLSSHLTVGLYLS